jgi:hypothetical protein
LTPQYRTIEIEKYLGLSHDERFHGVAEILHAGIISDRVHIPDATKSRPHHSLIEKVRMEEHAQLASPAHAKRANCDRKGLRGHGQDQPGLAVHKVGEVQFSTAQVISATVRERFRRSQLSGLS